jgi:hypothetical protein
MCCCDSYGLRWLNSNSLANSNSSSSSETSGIDTRHADASPGASTSDRLMRLKSPNTALTLLMLLLLLLLAMLFSACLV